MLSHPVGLFINYASCVEEKRYCEDASKVKPVLSRGIDPSVDRALDFYALLFGKQLVEEIEGPEFAFRKDLASLRKARVSQLILFFCVARWLSSRFEVTYASGYRSEEHTS